MGLHNTAHYLKTKGRGDDTELVHMTKGEVHALKGLAAKHGGELTINPETGLPEAGFLSNILPTVAGIAATVITENPAIGAAVAGGLSYAESGSITKGLMAGISAYGLGAMGGELATMGAESIGQAAVPAAEEAGTKALLETGFNPTGTLGADQIGALTSKGVLTPAQASAYGSAYSSAFPAASTTANLGAGLSAAAQAPGQFVMNNLGNIGMAAAPLFTGIGNKAAIPAATSNTGSNPMGMKTIPTDANGKPIFNATLPAQPSPAYVAKYPNYVKDPYNPYAPVGTTTPTYEVHAADGGLMQNGPDKTDFMGSNSFPMSQQDRSYYATPTQAPTGARSASTGYEPSVNPLTGESMGFAAGGSVPSYSGTYGSVVGIGQATQNLQDLYGHHTPLDTPRADVGIYQDSDPNTRNLDAYSASLYKLKQKAKAAGMKKDHADSLKPVLKLGDIEEDAEGGVVGMADGGSTSHVYKPTYANYQQTPYMPQAMLSPEQLQAATAAYNQQGIPTPTRTAVTTGTNPGIAGYAIDPKGMIGSPAYNEIQAQLKAAQDQLNAYQDAQRAALNDGSSGGGGGGYQGGIMPDDLKYAGGGFVPSLGGYAAGGNPRLLKGPGDGMSDSIPANIGGKQPARLADGEFVVPADVVSHLGNGSTDAGAKKLYSMMDNIRRARTGRKKQAPAVKADKYLPK